MEIHLHFPHTENVTLFFSIKNLRNFLSLIHHNWISLYCFVWHLALLLKSFLVCSTAFDHVTFWAEPMNHGGVLLQNQKPKSVGKWMEVLGEWNIGRLPYSPPTFMTNAWCVVLSMLYLTLSKKSSIYGFYKSLF